MAAFTGLALWLSPASPGDTRALSSLISTLSTSHSTPVFAPHVTLLTGIPTDAAPAALLSTLRAVLAAAPTTGSFPLSLTSLGSKAREKNYFQYLFARVDPANARLSELRRTVRAALLPAELAALPDDFFPHLSLMYGADTAERSAEELIQQLEGKVGVERMMVAEVLLVKCEGRPEEWEVLGSVLL